MPIHLILLILSALLLVIAAVLDWPRAPANPAIGHSLAWLGLASFVASFIVA